MIRHSKKIILTLLTFFSVLVIAGCSQGSNNSESSPAATTEVPKKVNDIEGEWKLTDIRNSIQSIYSLFEMDEIQFGYFLTIFDDLDMRLKVNGDKVEVSYSTDLNNFSNNLYKGTNKKDSAEVFKTNLFKRTKELADKYKTNKATMDVTTGAFSFYAPGTINDTDKTMSFQEPLNFNMSFPMTLTETYDPITYKYELKDNLLLVSLDGTDSETQQPVHAELRFERVTGSENNTSATTTNETASLDGKWELINSGDAFLRGLSYRLHSQYERKLLLQVYWNTLKDLKPTITISGNKATYEGSVNLTDAYNSIYEYHKKNAKIKLEPKEEYIRTYYFNSMIKTHLSASKYSKIDIDEANYTVHTVIPDGIVDTSRKTITFDNPMAISDLVIFSNFSIAILDTTYNYTIDGDILTLTYERHETGQRFNIYYELKFKKVQN